MMRIAVVGAGYVGLVTGVGLAEHGHHVVCVDVDAARVEAINAGRAPIVEAGLDELLARHAGERFTATTDIVDAVAASSVIFVCVGTPSRPISATSVWSPEWVWPSTGITSYASTWMPRGSRPSTRAEPRSSKQAWTNSSPGTRGSGSLPRPTSSTPSLPAASSSCASARRHG